MTPNPDPQCETILAFSGTRCHLSAGHKGYHVGNLDDAIVAEPADPQGGESNMEEANMGKLLDMPCRTFTARLLEVPWEISNFSVAGTLDGFIDLAVPGGGTYPLSLDEAEGLANALTVIIADVRAHCMYERDALLNLSKRAEAINED